MQQILTFDECALAIVLLFFISVVARREYTTRTNRILIWMLSLVLVTVTADLGAATMNNFVTGGENNIVLAYLFNYVYFAAHNMLLPVYLRYVYSSIDIWHLYRNNRFQHVLWWALVMIDVIVLVLNGSFITVFTITPDVNYVRGPWEIVFYIVAAIFILWIFLALIRYRKYIDSRKLTTLVFLFVVVILGLCIQLLNSRILVECFSIALSVLFFMVMERRSDNQINPITGALKYTSFTDRMTKNSYSQKPISVIFVKVMNNNNLHMYLGLKGHNEFLNFVTQKTGELCRNNDLNTDVYYMENGLYAVVCEDIDEERVAVSAEKIMDVLSRESRFGNLTVMPDVRMCVVFCPQDIHDAPTLFSLGTNFHRTLPDTRQVHYYRDFKDNMEYKVRNDLDEILRRAVANHGFEMYYQPIYSVKEKRFIAAEAMIRLNDPEYGQVPPALFIPAAEINGYIHDIGEFVFEDVIRFIASLDMDRLGLRYIEMNLSASQCIEVDLVDKIRTLMFEHGVESRYVSFELTEAATDMNPEIVDMNIRKLHEFGVQIALDDYGTGYSNIKRTTGLPIDQVKLDKSFVDMIDDPQMCIVIQDTISMFKEMGKEVLVEGVEQEEVARKFSDLDADLIQGCELMQGFYFCRPLPEKEFLEFIEQHR